MLIHCTCKWAVYLLTQFASVSPKDKIELLPVFIGWKKLHPQKTFLSYSDL